jgi:DNA-damage-inducible protein D
MDSSDAVVAFQAKGIKKVWHNEEWWFSVEDIISALTGTKYPKGYWYRIRTKEFKECASDLSSFCQELKSVDDPEELPSDYANTEGIFRIIQSIPSRKAEPFKRWLAQIGYDRIKEIENPELAQKRIREIYKMKGYPDSWVDKRLGENHVRVELTDEWDKRGIKTDRGYAILTSEISKATFGMTPKEYKELKGIKDENLRDNMTDLELIFMMLSEASTAKIAKTRDAKGFFANRLAAVEGGKVASLARKELERITGENVASPENFLKAPEDKKEIAYKKIEEEKA